MLSYDDTCYKCYIQTAMQNHFVQITTHISSQRRKPKSSLLHPKIGIFVRGLEPMLRLFIVTPSKILAAVTCKTKTKRKRKTKQTNKTFKAFLNFQHVENHLQYLHPTRIHQVHWKKQKQNETKNKTKQNKTTQPLKKKNNNNNNNNITTPLLKIFLFKVRIKNVDRNAYNNYIFIEYSNSKKIAY